MKTENFLPIDIDDADPRGAKYLKGYDFAIMDNTGKIDYYNYSDPIPFYSF